MVGDVNSLIRNSFQTKAPEPVIGVFPEAERAFSFQSYPINRILDITKPVSLRVDFPKVFPIESQWAEPKVWQGYYFLAPKDVG